MGGQWKGSTNGSALVVPVGKCAGKGVTSARPAPGGKPSVASRQANYPPAPARQPQYPPAGGGGMDNLTRSADDLYANILNLARPVAQLRQQFEKLVALREQIGSAGKGGKAQGSSGRIAPSPNAGKGQGKLSRPTPAAASTPATENAKMLVNSGCQRLIGRPLAKGDVEYSIEEVVGGFQGTVTLNCFEGAPSFIGEVGVTEKEASQLVAEQVWANYRDDFEAAAADSAGTSKKRKKAAGTVSTLTPTGSNADKNGKLLLNELAMKIVARTLTKGEVCYESAQVDEGWQSTVTLPFLPGEWAESAWTGEVGTDRRTAEHNAASVAAASLQEAPEFQENIHRPTAKERAEEKRNEAAALREAGVEEEVEGEPE